MTDQADAAPDAFLSYTRIDNEFYGGAITSFRKLLELGVKVVTGQRDFNIFQDVDDIELGQPFQKRLDQAINGTWFFIPIVTPLFFNSQPCRDELQKFLAHEKALARDDLILPIYYVTAPVLEKPDLRAKDLLASEIHARQFFDWRTQADLAIDDPRIRKSVRELADKIAAAIARTETPGLEANFGNQVFRAQPTAQDEIAKEQAFRDASELVRKQQPEPQGKQAERAILWVDDHPDDDILERQALQAYNIRFELAQSTGEALAKLQNTRIDAIISDMARPPDSHAGYTLLEALRDGKNQIPYFIFSASNSPHRVEEARRLGAQGSTNVSEELIAKVLACLNAKS